MRELAQHLFGARESAIPRMIVGVVLGTVTNNKDKDGLNRVAVSLPWLTDLDASTGPDPLQTPQPLKPLEIWARVAAPMAGNNRGFYTLPEVDDEVLVAFERGDVRFPFVVGCLWNGKDKSPVTNADGNNDERVFKSRSGHQLRFIDKPGHELVEIVDASGKNSIVIDTATNSVTITADQDISLTAPNGTVTISAKTIDVKASDDARFTAGGTGMLQASDDLTVQGKTVSIN